VHTHISLEGSPSSETYKYNLKPCNKGQWFFSRGTKGGVGQLDEKIPKTSLRDGKSCLSIAHKQANSKIRSGRQQSLIGALRESSPEESAKLFF
jgi:hypothetical protein